MSDVHGTQYQSAFTRSLSSFGAACAASALIAFVGRRKRMGIGTGTPHERTLRIGDATSG
jgi:hypothetical protein